MTRAKHSLSLISPLRYHVTQQRRDGDKHVFGARSRFMTDDLLDTMDRTFHGRRDASSKQLQPLSNKKLDAPGKMLDMW
jgi:DNA helicase-2/ATP-dependent DNA helicase PcrA